MFGQRLEAPDTESTPLAFNEETQTWDIETETLQTWLIGQEI